mmetsp:Transcript_21431/g.29776  ORF Transcript_21431/g.29776 Transcript_21431/m.29776 type:complete len:249 (+) Transcript_21431:153-899(+)|eukprot:CAMPEP_0196573150 /NCGR_PEP_ID=MMETSP1081-20130531/3096_1 /TAXON_ID=36882 /ORGANISM="Pyramimonas amylifera, Strain CCMP720" /LENGTH=248 /DNA_ID=CAMNT_0041890765 /DNA_START=96 /DNA_END=842 /DNA_ORIENTATION=+
MIKNKKKCTTKTVKQLKVSPKIIKLGKKLLNKKASKEQSPQIEESEEDTPSWLEDDKRKLSQSLCKSLKSKSPSFLDSEMFAGENLVKLEGGGGLDAQLRRASSAWKLPLCHTHTTKPSMDRKVRAPCILVLTGSALRALEIIRELPSFNNSCRIHKLFSKHIKVEEQSAALNCHLCIAVGTPNRVQKLVDLEALELSSVKVVFLDTKPDAKQREMLTINEIRDDFWSLFNLHLRLNIQNKTTKLCLF